MISENGKETLAVMIMDIRLFKIMMKMDTGASLTGREKDS